MKPLAFNDPANVLTARTLARTAMQTLMGMPVHVSDYATERVEDWSLVRSAARARRRMKRGHRQNVRMVDRPCIYVLQGMGGNGRRVVMHGDALAEVAKRAWKVTL